MKKIILCGGSGYIGTKLTEHLLDNTNYEIVIVDRLDFKLEKYLLTELEEHIKGPYNKYNFRKALIDDYIFVKVIIFL